MSDSFREGILSGALICHGFVLLVHFVPLIVVFCDMMYTVCDNQLLTVVLQDLYEIEACDVLIDVSLVQPRHGRYRPVRTNM